LIGATATGLEDLRVTPFDPVLPGVELHAAVIDNILRQNFLVRPRWAHDYTALLIVLVGILLTVGLPRLGAVRSVMVTGGLVLTSLLVNYVAFISYGLWLDIVAPIVAIVWVAAGLTVYRYAIEEKDKRFLRKTFATYLSPTLIEQMVATKTAPRLGGASGPRTAYFTDIASFSSFSEVLSPQELVELINEYLTAMTDILLAEGGTLDKYEGDAILAFFGAPIYMPDHATRAVRTALGMQQALAELREKWRGEGDKWPPLVHHMRMRIGINAGEFVTGNMGSATRMDYTMMGDVVNTAARLESSAKQYGIYIQSTVETISMTAPDLFAWRPIDKVQVVGRAEPIETVEIMAYKGELPAQQLTMCELFQQGLALYRQQNWDAAIKTFTESEALEDMFPARPTNPSRVFLERSAFFKANPPGANWDGIWILTSK
jgi:adenylate cyclase